MNSPFQRFSTAGRAAPTAAAAVSSIPTTTPVAQAESVSATSAPAQAAVAEAVAHPPVAAPAPEPVRTDATVQKIAVVVGNSDPRFAALMTGVTGKLGENGFEIDPMYGKVAYLFELMQDGGAANEAGYGESHAGTQITEITLDNEDQVRALQMHLLSQRVKVWDSFYESVLPDALSKSDVARRMLERERQKSNEAVARVIAESGVRDFFVPVKLEAIAPQLWDEAERYGDRATLLKAAKLIPTTLAIDLEREVLEAAPAGEEPALDEAIAAHDGAITLNMSSWMTVSAKSAADAPVVLAKLLELRETMHDVIDVDRIHDGHIDRVELEPRVADADEDDDGDYPGERG